MTIGPEVTFDHPTPLSRKVACSVCGATGYGLVTANGLDPGYNFTPWQQKCLRGHAPCPDCGRWMSLRKDGRSPTTHTRCPKKKYG